MNQTRCVLLLALCSCSKPSSRPASAVTPETEVKVWGNLREMMHEGRTESRVAIGPLLSRPHMYAVGALAGMRGEITILDGTAWRSLGDRDSGRATAGATEDGASLLVASYVAGWSRVTITQDIPFADLDQRIEALAAAAGIDVDKPFPFLVEGQLTDARWHVLKGPPSANAPHDHTANAVTGEQAAITGTLVGFFSKHHHGSFTHMGQNVHAHLVDPASALAAHVDQVSIPASSILVLPR
jgi:alpha-acetolactate decarboxylase